MGRAKGSVEVVLDKKQVDEVCACINAGLPETVKGAMGAAPEKTFNEYATKSASTVGHGYGCVLKTLHVLYDLCCQICLFDFLCFEASPCRRNSFASMSGLSSPLRW